MPISSFSDYEDRVKNCLPILLPARTSGRLGIFISSWTGTPLLGFAPTSPVAPDNETLGALSGEYFQTYTKDRYIAQISLEVGGVSNSPFLLCDRLSHQGQLVGDDTNPQTTNLPTAALTRYTDGVGVMMAVEIYVQLGTTAQTITASYTNQAGTPGRTSKPVLIGGTGNREVAVFKILPLQDGDTGVRSVESITLSGSTGIAGNFGVVLFKPILGAFHGGQVICQLYPHTQDALKFGAGILPRVHNNACLFYLATQSLGGQSAFSYIKIIEAD